MALYTLKPPTVEAEQYEEGKPIKEQLIINSDTIAKVVKVNDKDIILKAKQAIFNNLNTGIHILELGDYIVTTDDGRKEHWTKERFEATYELQK